MEGARRAFLPAARWPRMATALCFLALGAKKKRRPGGTPLGFCFTCSPTPLPHSHQGRGNITELPAFSAEEDAEAAETQERHRRRLGGAFHP